MADSKRAPATFASTKECFLSRVSSILEMLLRTKEFDARAFYAKHLGTYGNIYLHVSDFPDEEWGRAVVNDALNIIDVHEGAKKDDGLLQEGDKFKFKNLPKSHYLIGRLIHNDNQLRPIMDFQDCHFDMVDRTTCSWVERNVDGWEKRHSEVINEAAPAFLLDQVWEVQETEFTGGTAPDAHDPYPNGHHVMANCHVNDVLYEVRFYQTGCFIGMCPPEMIEIIE